MVKLIDMFFVALIVLGIAMTVLNFIAQRRPMADVQSVEIHEVK